MHLIDMFDPMKNTILTPKLCFLILTLLAPYLHAQGWEQDFSTTTGSVNWIIQANDGTILVGGSNGMAGIDPATGKVKWQDTRLARQNPGSVELVEGMPLMIVKGSSGSRSEDYGAMAILNTFDGTLIFSSRDANVEVLERTLIPETYGILLQTKKEDNLELAYYDLVGAKARWNIPLREAKSGGRGVVKALQLPPVFSLDGALILALDKTVRALDINTGATRWEHAYEDEANLLSISASGEYTFVGVDRSFDVINTKTGEKALTEPYELRADALGVDEDNGEYLVRSQRGLNIFDPDGPKPISWEAVSKPSKCLAVTC